MKEPMKETRDGIKFPSICPACGSNETVVATYSDDERFVECEECYTVIGDIPTGKHYAISKDGKRWK